MPNVHALDTPLGLGQTAHTHQDTQKVLAAQSGDIKAFDALVLKYRARLYRVLYNLSSNHEEANDLTQEAFIKAFRCLSTFKHNATFFTWLYRIGVNTAFNHFKKHKNRQFLSLNELGEESLKKSDRWLEKGANTEEALRLGELQKKLNESLQKLSTKHRAVVTLVEIENLSCETVGEILKISPGTVRSRLHYAKQKMRKDLKNWL